MKKVLILLCILGIARTMHGQIVPEKTKPAGFAKKFVWGFTFQSCWSTIKGSSLPGNSYFAKPSLGLSANAEYYFLPFIGIGIGAGYQQRGTGITYTANQYTTERLRFNTLEFPIAVSLRTPKDLIKGLRLGGSVAIVPVLNMTTRDVFNNLQPSIGNTDIVYDKGSLYFKNDVAYQISVGPEINAGGTGILKVHFLYSQGTTNVFKDGTGNGHNQAVGLSLAFLF